MTSRFNRIELRPQKRPFTKPSINPRPPTQPGGSPALDPLGWQYEKVAGTPSATVSVNYETGLAGDIILLVALGGLTTAGTTAPSGFTLFDSTPDQIYVWYRIADGTESGVATWNNPSKGIYATNRIKANGATLSVTNWLYTDASGSLNPPAVTLGDFAYVVLPLLQVVLDIVGDDITTFPTGYTVAVDPGPATENADWNGAITQRNITGPGTEDPSTFGVTGSLSQAAATLAIEISAADPTVAEFDHTHGTADVTDVATASALGQILASDGDSWETLTVGTNDQVLTADSAQPLGVKWADAGSIADHGALTGLADDDHTQYTKADGTRAFTGTVSGITPTADAHLATKAYVDSQVPEGAGEVLMQDGVTAPPVPIENEARDDWLYEDSTEASGSSSSEAFSGAILQFRGTPQNIPDQTYTFIEYDTEVRDNGGYADLATHPTRLTVPTAGVYRFHADIVFDGEASFNTARGNFRVVRFNINRGTTGRSYFGYVYAAAHDTDSHAMSISGLVELSANDYVEVNVYQNSGETLTVPQMSAADSRFSVVRVADLS